LDFATKILESATEGITKPFLGEETINGSGILTMHKISIFINMEFCFWFPALWAKIERFFWTLTVLSQQPLLRKWPNKDNNTDNFLTIPISNLILRSLAKTTHGEGRFIFRSTLLLVATPPRILKYSKWSFWIYVPQINPGILLISRYHIPTLTASFFKSSLTTPFQFQFLDLLCNMREDGASQISLHKS